jgi:hypothetical protein
MVDEIAVRYVMKIVSPAWVDMETLVATASPTIQPPTLTAGVDREIIMRKVLQARNS